MDTCSDDSQASAIGASGCATEEPLTVFLPPIDATCDSAGEKVVKKAGRKASKTRQEVSNRYYSTDCKFHCDGRGEMVQCHLCVSIMGPSGTRRRDGK